MLIYRCPACTFVTTLRLGTFDRLHQPYTDVVHEGDMPRNPLQIDGFHPTIGSVYHVVEDYLERLAALSGAGVNAPPLTVPPIDALLIHLLAMYQPVRPKVVDLAATRTWGVSTLLCRTNPSIHRVVTTLENPPEKWRTILDHHLRDGTMPLVECITVEETRHLFDQVPDPQAPLLVIASSQDAARQQSPAAFENWLESEPKAVLVLLGVEKAGDSASLASLIVRCTGSTYRLALPREMAPALSESRIALVFRRDNAGLESMLVRIGQLFANQFQFLDLIKGMCDSALEQGILNEPISSTRGGVLDPQTLTTAYDLRRALMEREQELLELRQSFTFRIVQGIRKLSRFGRRTSSSHKSDLKQCC